MLDGTCTAAVTESGRQEIVWRFYDKLFAGEGSAGRLPRWIFKSWGEDIFLGWPELDGVLLGKLLCKLASNKSCGEDTIVAEMLKALDRDDKISWQKSSSYAYGTMSLNGLMMPGWCTWWP